MRDHLGRDLRGVRRKPRQQRAIANQIDQTGNAARQPVHTRQRVDGKGDRRGAAGDRQPVRHVRGHGFAIQRLQLIPDGHSLVELTQVRRSQLGLQLELTDQDDLQQFLLVGLEIRQDANLFEHRERQVLRFVDDEHRARVERNEPQQKVVQRVDELLLAHAREPAGFDLLARDHAEVLKDALEEVLFGQERVQDERRERIAIDLFEQRAADRRLAGPDVARDDDEAFPPADGVLQEIERVAV